MCRVFGRALPARDESPVLEHENLVRLANGAQALCDDERGTPFHQPRERLLYEHLGRRIDA